MSFLWILDNLETVGGVGLALLALYYLWPTNKDHILLKRFGLDPAEWRVLGHDLGRGGNPYGVRALGLIGKPDFVAQHRRRKILKVFDYKHRTFKGQPRLYEVYQVTLYCMALEAMHPGYTVLAAIKYKNKILDVRVHDSDRAKLLRNRDLFRSKYL